MAKKKREMTGEEILHALFGDSKHENQCPEQKEFARQYGTMRNKLRFLAEDSRHFLEAYSVAPELLPSDEQIALWQKIYDDMPWEPNSEQYKKYATGIENASDHMEELIFGPHSAINGSEELIYTAQNLINKAGHVNLEELSGEERPAAAGRLLLSDEHDPQHFMDHETAQPSEYEDTSELAQRTFRILEENGKIKDYAEIGVVITPERIDQYIDALEQKKEFSQNGGRKVRYTDQFYDSNYHHTSPAHAMQRHLAKQPLLVFFDDADGSPNKSIEIDVIRDVKDAIREAANDMKLMDKHFDIKDNQRGR